MAETQQSWQFLVGDGATPTEGFTQLPHMVTMPEFTPVNLTMRDATTIADAAASPIKKTKFNRMHEGQELSITCWFEPGNTVQDYVLAQAGLDAGINVRYQFTGEDFIETWAFNCLVKPPAIVSSAANDENAVDSITIVFKVNSIPVKTRTAVA